MRFLGSFMSTRRAITVVAATLLLIAGCAGQREHTRDWPDGRAQERGALDGYKPVGTWSTWHADGTLASEGATDASPGGFPNACRRRWNGWRRE